MKKMREGHSKDLAVDFQRLYLVSPAKYVIKKGNFLHFQFLNYF